MKTRAKSTSTRNIDLIVSKLNGKEILEINEMLYIRGGDGEIVIPPLPSDYQKKN